MIAQKYIKKRGQIQLNETILVLFVIVIIILIGVFIFYRYSVASIESAAETLSEQEVSVLLTSIPSISEISCNEKKCLDTAKFIPFKNLANKKKVYYYRNFGSKRITVEQIYPDVGNNFECTYNKYREVNYPDNCKYWVLYENKPANYKKNFKVSTVVSLYFPEINEYRIGRISIEVYL